MAYVQRDNNGSLFKNTYKKTDAQPEYTGNGKFNGVEGKLSGWLKDSQKGKYISFSFTPIDNIGENAFASKASVKVKEIEDEIDDEIFF
jgi:hypothetical protein